ncbi:S-adenosyl-L-methionine-dependent methyltransferase [Viridothelium virens]|uniref:S-adenosyl-L-methionine-dependent methyltransferase n=1 Tax=Viridothelium virens TaxID=1048519 RepID=A0A6A6HCH1_VIRVR|nr:S-adenosyl-L-methionine-dependent methyltransferase [Viridothelium virens]
MSSPSVAFQQHPHTYHDTKAAYLLPNSCRTAEQERLAGQAAALKALVGGNVLHTTALPDSPDARFLDIGCGTGSVTYDIARQFPSAKVYGLDLSAIQILDDKPPNVEFVKGDLFELAGHDERLQLGSFDFVFSRLLICGMTDWVKYLKTVASLLKRGAPCEFQEYTWEHYRDGKRVGLEWRWLQAARAGAKKRGLDLDCGKHMAGYAHNAGLVGITQKTYDVPAGTWMAKSNPQAEIMGIDSERAEIVF